MHFFRSSNSFNTIHQSLTAVQFESVKLFAEAKKEFGKNLSAIKHVDEERAKSNKEPAAPVPYYILLVMAQRRTENSPNFLEGPSSPQLAD